MNAVVVASVQRRSHWSNRRWRWKAEQFLVDSESTPGERSWERETDCRQTEDREMRGETEKKERKKVREKC